MKRALQLIALLLTSLLAIAQRKPAPTTVASSWFPRYAFSLTAFTKPTLSYGPMARWWWPGNDVTKDELRREINLLADHGFAGVEVQPLNIGLPLNDQTRPRILSWDTPDYYDKLKVVMETARQRQMIVDMTDGSGWPPGGPFLDPADGFLSLESAAVTIEGGKSVSIALPRVDNRSDVPARLQAVVAARQTSPASDTSNSTVSLEGSSSSVLTAYCKNDTLTWTFPTGSWKVIAFWSIPSGERTNIAASPKQGPVVDHFDSTKVLKLYTHLFGARTGLPPYFGNPMRAIFNDSYEFKANRHFSPDLIAYFKKKRGYDITPWLPANMQKGYNFVAYLRPNATPSYSFSEQDWRLRYDYDVTLGELLGEHFFKTSRNWTEKQGLLHRTQAYGLNMDMITMAGLASIPETESMLGPEAYMKVMTSGALLYNRPLVSAESVVFINRAYTITPQLVRTAVDKLFAAGVNQVVYHGVPYRYFDPRLGDEGWNPFSTPLLGMINFSSNLGEGNQFWSDQKELNTYVSRVQYALRAGKPQADVLIYWPFLNVEGLPDNPEEILTKGSFTNEPATSETGNPKVAWAEKVYPVINRLEANGLSWAWVNDASLQEATLDKASRITIRGNTFQALILANDSILSLKTAERIRQLAGNGMKLLATGALPTKQPSFLHWQKADRLTAGAIKEALTGKNSRYVSTDTQLQTWLNQLATPVKFVQPYGFTRQVKREMADGSRVQFIWNKSDQWQTLTLSLDKKFRRSYWLNAEDGSVVNNTGSTVSYTLPPYGSVLLYASTGTSMPTGAVSQPPLLADRSQTVLTLSDWSLKTDSLTLDKTPLFDWKTNDKLKYTSSAGIYTTTFEWAPTTPAKAYFLDLNTVDYTAEVFLNGQSAGKRIFEPFQFNITPLLKPGTNQLEIRVTPGQLNGYIGKAKAGDKRYAQFKKSEGQLMSAGLIGPVVIHPAR